jgi:hypothetical protein
MQIITLGDTGYPSYLFILFLDCHFCFQLYFYEEVEKVSFKDKLAQSAALLAVAVHLT